MATILKEGTESTDVCPDNATYIVDGGYLLRKVRWQAKSTYRELCVDYVNYVLRHFGENSIVVFDGYGDMANSTKSHEHLLRAAKGTSRELQFDLDMQTVTTQESFLSNHLNKSRLLSKLKLHFSISEIRVKQAEADANASSLF